MDRVWQGTLDRLRRGALDELRNVRLASSVRRSTTRLGLTWLALVLVLVLTSAGADDVGCVGASASAGDVGGVVSDTCVTANASAGAGAVGLVSVAVAMVSGSRTCTSASETSSQAGGVGGVDRVGKVVRQSSADTGAVAGNVAAGEGAACTGASVVLG